MMQFKSKLVNLITIFISQARTLLQLEKARFLVALQLDSELYAFMDWDLDLAPTLSRTHSKPTKSKQ